MSWLVSREDICAAVAEDPSAPHPYGKAIDHIEVVAQRDRLYFILQLIRAMTKSDASRESGAFMGTVIVTL